MAFPPGASDSKRCQTLINKAAQAARALQLSAADLMTVRQRFLDANPDTTGTPLQGNLSAVSTWITNVNDVATSAVANQMIAAERPNHRCEY